MTPEPLEDQIQDAERRAERSFAHPAVLVRFTEGSENGKWIQEPMPEVEAGNAVVVHLLEQAQETADGLRDLLVAVSRAGTVDQVKRVVTLVERAEGRLDRIIRVRQAYMAGEAGRVTYRDVTPDV